MNTSMRRAFFLILPALVLAPALLADAQVIKLIPCAGGDTCRACDLVKLIDNVITFLLSVGVVIIITLALVIAGVKMVTGGGGSDLLKAAARDIFIGIVIALCAWLIIDTGLKLLVKDPNFGPWNQVQCINNPVISSAGTWTPASQAKPGDSGYTGPTGGGVQCDPANVACSVAALQEAGYTEAQANVMSCIAMTESTGNPNAVNPNGGACGTFQALPAHWRASYAPTGCSYANCTNVSCNIQMAYILSQQRIQQGLSAYGPWTCPGCNNKAQGCVDRYDPAV